MSWRARPAGSYGGQCAAKLTLTLALRICARSDAHAHKLLHPLTVTYSPTSTRTCCLRSLSQCRRDRSTGTRCHAAGDAYSSPILTLKIITLSSPLHALSLSPQPHTLTRALASHPCCQHPHLPAPLRSGCYNQQQAWRYYHYLSPLTAV